MFSVWYQMHFSYILILVPALILSAYASTKVKTTFAKYSTVMSSGGLTGADVARRILAEQGITNVGVEAIRGNLTDHYDPRAKMVRLSDSVYGKASIAAIAVAAHECGHAIQHDVGYVPLNMRSSLAPVATFASQLAMPLFFIGLLSSSGGEVMLQMGIIFFSAAVLFQLVTLPVEFNASSRALKIMLDYNIVNEREENGAKKVLSAAALTYVAAALTSLLSLIRLILIARNRNN